MSTSHDYLAKKPKLLPLHFYFLFDTHKLARPRQTCLGTSCHFQVRLVTFSRLLSLFQRTQLTSPWDLQTSPDILTSCSPHYFQRCNRSDRRDRKVCDFPVCLVHAHVWLNVHVISPSTKQRWNHRRCGGASLRGPEDRGLVTPPTQTHSIRLVQSIGAIDGICCLAAACSSETPYRYILHIKGNSSEFDWFLVAGLLEFLDFTSTSVLVWESCETKRGIWGQEFILYPLNSNKKRKKKKGGREKSKHSLIQYRFWNSWQDKKPREGQDPQFTDPSTCFPNDSQAVKRLLIYNINAARKELRADPVRATDMKWMKMKSS